MVDIQGVSVLWDKQKVNVVSCHESSLDPEVGSR